MPQNHIEAMAVTTAVTTKTVHASTYFVKPLTKTGFFFHVLYSFTGTVTWRFIMIAIGFFNRFSSFPAPVVLVVRKGRDFIAAFPTGHMSKMYVPPETNDDTFTRDPKFFPFENPVVLTKQTAAAVAFDRNDVYIGETKKDLEKEVRTRLRRKTLTAEMRTGLMELLENSKRGMRV